jgi:hypothetical protein
VVALVGRFLNNCHTQTKRLPLMLISLDNDLMRLLPENSLLKTKLVEADPRHYRARVRDVEDPLTRPVTHGGANRPFRGYNRYRSP